MACLHVAKLHVAAGEFSDALRALNMGLIMGGPLSKPDLHSLVSVVAAKARATRVRQQQQKCPNSDRRLGRQDVVSEEVRNGCEELRSIFGGIFERILVSGLSGGNNRWHGSLAGQDYLTKVAGDRTVPVEVGKNYLYPEWKQGLITFSQFLERIQANGSASAAPTYLAQHPLFDQIHELREDICIPDYCFAGGGELRSAGTVTPLHHDPHHNVLAQVVGKKYVRLYLASLSEELYPYTEIMLCNSSQVDLDKFPKMHDLEFHDCILEEGDMIYIPPKWWHHMRSLTPSLSVSFWWSEYESS
nr:lysine-specific demethylase JMJ30-like [Malus domestica]